MTDPKAESKGKGTLDEVVDKLLTKATEKFMDPILTYIGEFCSEFTGYLADFDEHVKALEVAALDLRATRTKLEKKVEHARSYSRSKQPSTKVEAWYKEEEVTRKNVPKLVEQGNREDGRLCLGKWCFGRLRYGKEVVTCCKLLRALKEDGDLIKDEELLEQGTPDIYQLLSRFQDKFDELSNVIIDIEELYTEVKNELQAENRQIRNRHEITSWLKKVEKEVKTGEQLISRKNEHVNDIQVKGYGQPHIDAVQNEVTKCTKIINDHHKRGKELVELLQSGMETGVFPAAGASCSNEAPPQPLPQPA